ncbi:MAG: ABC transporter ATP-binding protein [Deltaproteobacteria bacterium]|nr:ABC transporter ATP-binding protein [Deltaproteobacteria bacterium]
MITIKNLSKSYNGHKILDQIDLTISGGNIFALLGPNGSGKTTILKSILEIVRPSKNAEIIWNGESIVGTNRFKAEVGYMPQLLKFPPHIKVKELITLFEKLRHKEGLYKNQLIQDLEINLFWNQVFGELSGGMAQKINILQCFMFDSSLFILDEPTSGLDPQVAYYLKQLICEKKKVGNTILFTSHVMAEVDAMADEMALLVEGKVYTIISPAALKKQKNTTSLEEALNQFWNTTKNHEKNI